MIETYLSYKSATYTLPIDDNKILPCENQYDENLRLYFMPDTTYQIITFEDNVIGYVISPKLGNTLSTKPQGLSEIDFLIETSQVQSYVQENQNNVDDTLDYLFDWFEKKINQNEFSTCDLLIKNINSNVHLYNNKILIGILTITNIWKENFSLRATLFLNIKKKFIDCYSNNDIESVLSGLE